MPWALAACPIGLILSFADVISHQLDIPDNMEILLAVAMGYPDKESPVNKIKTDREDLSEILSWYE